jgi:hypothetical protein
MYPQYSNNIILKKEKKEKAFKKKKTPDGCQWLTPVILANIGSNQEVCSSKPSWAK